MDFKRLLIEPRYSQLKKAEEDIPKDSWISTLAAVNMGWYPFESKDKILNRVKQDIEKIESEYNLPA